MAEITDKYSCTKIDVVATIKNALSIMMPKNNWEAIKSLLDIVLEIQTLDKKEFFNARFWVNCTNLSSEVLKNTIQYCIDNNVWDNEQPNLHRFIIHTTVDHLKVLYDVGGYKTDIVYAKNNGTKYGGFNALESLFNNEPALADIDVKFEYLIETYSYTNEELIRACALAYSKSFTTIAEKIVARIIEMNKIANPQDARLTINPCEEIANARLPSGQEPEICNLVNVVQTDVTNVLQNIQEPQVLDEPQESQEPQNSKNTQEPQDSKLPTNNVDAKFEIIIQNEEMLITKDPDGTIKKWRRETVPKTPVAYDNENNRTINGLPALMILNPGNPASYWTLDM